MARWTSVDPLASSMASWSPYNYVFNNPLKFTDPTGMAPFGDYYDQNGDHLGSDGIDDGKVYLADEGQTTESLGLNSSLPLSNVIYAQTREENTTEVGGLIIAIRDAEGDDYTQSSVDLVGGDGVENQVETLEPGGPETETPNQDRRIPDGVYDVDSYSSARYPDNFILSNENVSQDRRILIHAGNYPRNTEGCIMPGCSRGTGSVSSSREAMGDVRRFINSKNTSVVSKKDDVKMIIKTRIPDDE